MFFCLSFSFYHNSSYVEGADEEVKTVTVSPRCSGFSDATAAAGNEFSGFSDATAAAGSEFSGFSGATAAAGNEFSFSILLFNFLFTFRKLPF